MISHAAKVAALFLAAGIGLYVGDLLGSLPLDALPYEYWCPVRFERNFHGVVAGVFTTCFVFLAAKFLRFPELVAVVVALAYSVVLPINETTTFGDGIFSVSGLYTILYFQGPYFLGTLAVFGLFYIAKLSLQTLCSKEASGQ